MSDRLFLRLNKMIQLIKYKKTRKGKFGIYGGQYVPECLMGALNELERAFETAMSDKLFLYLGAETRILILF